MYVRVEYIEGALPEVLTTALTIKENERVCMVILNLAWTSRAAKKVSFEVCYTVHAHNIER